MGIGEIIGLIIVGLIVGALGRLFHPGVDSMGILMTMAIGIASALLVGWLVGGGILGFILAPVGLLLLALLVIGGVIVGLLSLLAPLIPVALLALLIWAIYRLGQRRPTPTF